MIEHRVTDDGLRYEELNFAVTVAQGGKDQLPLVALEKNSTGNCNGHFRFGSGFERAMSGTDFGKGVRAVETIRIWVHARIAERVDLVEASIALGRQTMLGIGCGFGGLWRIGGVGHGFPR